MGAIISAMITWIFQAVVIKFIIFTALFLLISEAVPLVMSVLAPDSSLLESGGVASAINAMPAGVVWGLGLFQVPLGFTLIMTALVGRFILRRIPFLN